MRQLFGTDGIRGKADEFPLDPATMFALGETVVAPFRSNGERPMILLGMDTRESGSRIAQALMAGIEHAGGEPTFIGVVPTPAVAYLCRVTPAKAAISISASHNPFQDNGVKVFGHDGMKLSDDLELQIEKSLLAARREGFAPSRTAPLQPSVELIEQYETFLADSMRPDALTGIRIVLDTGHGAAYQIAPEVFRRGGAEVVVINDKPNGRNINEASGALHPEGLAAAVIREKAAFGVAFDGDADRAIFVDDRGNVRDGDEIIFLWALDRKKRGTLRNDLVVTTVMSNFGFEKSLADHGIRLLRASVGDKYVLEMMQKHGARLGGEQSGHIIDLEVHSTGDGVHTALVMAELLAAAGRPFSEIQTFDPMPQVLVNEKVASKPPLETLPRYQAAAAEASTRLGGTGRILVRYSGTENLVRVMVEGKEEGTIREVAETLRKVLKEEIG